MFPMALSEDFLQFCKGLANNNRQQILFSVFTDKQEHTVSEVANNVGIAQSTASEHLSLLKRAGVLVSEKRDREVYYMVNKDKIRQFVDLIEEWLTCC